MVPFFSIIDSFKSPAGTSLYVNFLGNKSIVFCNKYKKNLLINIKKNLLTNIKKIVFFRSSFDIISWKLRNCKICSCFPKSIGYQPGSSMSSSTYNLLYTIHYMHYFYVQTLHDEIQLHPISNETHNIYNLHPKTEQTKRQNYFVVVCLFRFGM